MLKSFECTQRALQRKRKYQDHSAIHAANMESRKGENESTTDCIIQAETVSSIDCLRFLPILECLQPIPSFVKFIPTCNYCIY